MKNTGETHRIKNKVANIDYKDTLQFFEHRAQKYNDVNPYSVTMYQDDNPTLVENRNSAEIQKLLPFLRLDAESKILDLACGIGRWSDAICEDIKEYCGIDFSGKLIEIAKARTTKANRYFYEGDVNSFSNVLLDNDRGKYNRFLLMGILIYVNDDDLEHVMQQILDVSEEHAIVCIREPLGIIDRLTLKEFYSNELKENYNAIYRTKNELEQVFKRTLLANGFNMADQGFMFADDSLNNRKETAQYYFVMER